MKFRAGRRLLLCSLGFVLPLSAAFAAQLTVQVTDSAGQALVDAVVSVEPAGGQAVPKPLRSAEIEQKNRKFLPLVTVIQTGSAISFPNHDTVRHHVYSFSAAKAFDIALYSGVPAAPMTFDKTGTVVLGCNIHDQMLAYIHVVPTPYFAKTDAAGNARIANLVPGKYRLKSWHYILPVNAPDVEQDLVLGDGDATISLKLNVKASSVEK